MKLSYKILFTAFSAMSFSLLLSLAATAQGEKKVLDPYLVLTPEFGFKENPAMMTRTYLQARIDAKKVDWQKRYETVKTIEDAKKYQQERIDYFLSAIGPFPEKTPLNPKIVKTHQKEGYRIEAILLETMPNFYLSGLMFLPDSPQFKAPYPAMLVTCGHSAEGKGSELYQSACALAALHGIAAFIIDPIDQGERHQHFRKDGRFYSGTTHAHNLVNFSSIPVGRSAAHFMIWDMIRCLDYFEQREDLDSERLAVAGNSGGGTQSSYLMALDPRVAVAAPSCYLCGLYGDLVRKDNPQDGEQNIYGQLGFGMDHADYVMMRAPRATLLCSATKDFFPIHDAWESFRYAKRFYDRFDSAEYVSLIETDHPHGWSKNLREGTIRWMVRWFYDKNVRVVDPGGLAVLPKEAAWCTEKGETLKLDGARSVYDFNRDYEKKLAEQRKKLWADGLTASMADRIRDRIAAKKFADLPEAKVESKTQMSVTTPGGVEAGMEKLVLMPEPGVAIPILRWTPKTQPEKATKPVLYLHGKGKTAGIAKSPEGFRSIEEYLQAGVVVVSADLRGIGETQFVGNKYFDHKHFGPDGNTYYMAYLLGQSYVGMRTEDVWHLARWMKKDAPDGIELYASGLAGTAALHAAALEPALFGSVLVEGSLVSWSNVVEIGVGVYPITDLVHDALTLYDISDLVRSLGEKVNFREPVNALSQPAGTPIVLPGHEP